MAKCDAVDGLADGLIDDPRKCAFDPARDVPSCPAGGDSADVPHAGASGHGREDLRRRRRAAASRGSRASCSAAKRSCRGRTAQRASGWTNLIVPGQPDAKPADFGLAEGVLRYLVFTPPRPDYDFRTFDFDRDVGLLERWGKLANANDPDLAKFRARGGKLLMTYGWADSILQPLMGVNYYERARREERTENAPTSSGCSWCPGMAHCAGGVGPDQNDAVTAVVDWVEKGAAPDSLVASKIVDGRVVRSRPLCPYPQVARYRGEGSIDDAANFRCVAP